MTAHSVFQKDRQRLKNLVNKWEIPHCVQNDTMEIRNDRWSAQWQFLLSFRGAMATKNLYTRHSERQSLKILLVNKERFLTFVRNDKRGVRNDNRGYRNDNVYCHSEETANNDKSLYNFISAFKVINNGILIIFTLL